jgi:hypothetical protein
VADDFAERRLVPRADYRAQCRPIGAGELSNERSQAGGKHRIPSRVLALGQSADGLQFICAP